MEKSVRSGVAVMHMITDIQAVCQRQRLYTGNYLSSTPRALRTQGSNLNGGHWDIIHTSRQAPPGDSRAEGWPGNITHTAHYQTQTQAH
jgi:hypothetical protein